jgi:hypothetical protein
LAWAMGDSFQGMRVMGGDGAGAPAEMGTGLGREMLWCFPFLQHFDFSSRRFVVDDLQYVLFISFSECFDFVSFHFVLFTMCPASRKAVLVLRVHQPGPTNRASSSAVFANHQFCHISGFSMARTTPAPRRPTVAHVSCVCRVCCVCCVVVCVVCVVCRVLCIACVAVCHVCVIGRAARSGDCVGHVAARQAKIPRCVA